MTDVQELLETRSMIKQMQDEKEQRKQSKRKEKQIKQESKRYAKQRKQEIKRIMKERSPELWWLFEPYDDNIRLKDVYFSVLYAGMMPGLYIRERKLRKLVMETEKKL